MKRPQPHPPHRRGTFHRRLQPLYTEKHKVSCSGFLPKTESLQHHAAIPMRSTSTDSKTPYNYTHKHTQSSLKPPLQCSKKTDGKPTQAAAPATQTRYLSSPAAATLHGKTKGFVLRLPPQNRALANIMQPFQCDLQAQIPKHPITTHTQAHPKQLEATVTMRQKKANRPQPHPPHTVPFIAGCSHFTRKNTRFRAPASSPTQSRCNIMQPFQCDLPPQLQETHRTTHTDTTTQLQNT